MLAAGISKPLIFVVISVMVAALVYSPAITAAVPNRSNDPNSTCTPTGKQGPPPQGLALVECCWGEYDPPGQKETFKTYCSTCEDGGTRGKINCSDPTPIRFGSMVPPSGPFVPPQGGAILEQIPGEGGGLQPPTRGQGVLQPGGLEQQPPADQGAAELPPPANEETQPATVEEEQPVPVCQESLEFNEDLGFCVPTECPEGQELIEETGTCVLEEQPAAAEEPREEAEPEEEQPSEESGSEEDNGNN